MNSGFSIVEYALWLSTMLVQGFACRLAVKKGFFATWRAFSYYLFFGLGQSLVLLAIARFARSEIYSTAYYTGSFIEAVLLSLVVLEIVVKVLDPFDSLPAREIAWFCFWAVFGITAAVAISIGPLLHNTLSEWALVTDRTIMLCDAALLWIILLRARSLGITWRSSVAEIALGFALFLTVQGVSRFLIATYHANLSLVSAIDSVGQAAYLFALFGWIWTMLNRDPLPPPPTAETLARMRTFTSNRLVTKEKVLAAVGVRINRVDPEEAPKNEPEAEHATVEP